jgi:predicted nucleotidyltransferase
VDLEKLVKTRTNFVHAENYEEIWSTLRERVDTVMYELQKMSLEAHHQSINTLNNWFKDVVNSMKEV